MHASNTRLRFEHQTDDVDEHLPAAPTDILVVTECGSLVHFVP